jgi:diguanylate cyclase (GGDEF)-like protein
MLPQSPLMVMGSSLLLWTLISGLDWWITLDLSLTLFYVLPVALATWGMGRGAGLSLVILSTLSWWVADISAKTYTHALLPYWNAGVRFGFFVLIHHLLLTLKHSYEQQRYWAERDSLTNLYNRRQFMVQLQAEYWRSQRDQQALTLAYLDLDNFKQANDRHGHEHGDQILKSVADILTQTLRQTDGAARLGGDEFALLLPCTDAAGARQLCDRLHRHLNSASQDHHWQVGFSLGVITWHMLPPSSEHLLMATDDLMYTVKRQGKNHILYRCH